MFRPLLKKTLHDAKWLLAACCAAVFAFCWLRVWIVSRVDTGRFKAILDLLPGDWQRFTPVDFDWLITYQGRISLAYDELIVVLCVSIWAIARGSDSVSGEIGRGTMEMLLAQPISRVKLLCTKASITIAGLVVLAATAWLGNWMGIQTTQVEEHVLPTIRMPVLLPGIGSELPIPFAQPKSQWKPMAEKMDSAVLIPASVNLFAMGIMLAGFTALMSSWDRYRWRTIGIVIGVYVVQVMIKLAGLASDQLSWLLYLSVFTPYEPEFMVRIADTAPEHLWVWQMVEHGEVVYGPLAYHAILVAVGVFSYIGAAIVFCRRDIPAPL
jgi:ABC-2 type transport system permease protein